MSRQPAGPQAALWVGVAQNQGHWEGQTLTHQLAAKGSPSLGCVMTGSGPA